jgi:hypothetical protein
MCCNLYSLNLALSTPKKGNVTPINDNKSTFHNICQKLPLSMKLSSSLFLSACALHSVTAFVPVARGSVESTSLQATVAGLTPPKKIEDLATSDLYDVNVQKTYGYVHSMDFTFDI